MVYLLKGWYLLLQSTMETRCATSTPATAVRTCISHDGRRLYSAQNMLSLRARQVGTLHYLGSRYGGAHPIFKLDELMSSISAFRRFPAAHLSVVRRAGVSGL